MNMQILSGVVFALICSPFLVMIIMIIRNMRKPNTTTVNLDKSITELLPIRYYDPAIDAYVKNTGKYMNLLKINTKDIYSASEEERMWDNMKFTKLYQTYVGELKYIILNFPTNTSEQQEYWRHKIELTPNPILKRQQEEKLYQLEWLQANSTKREFYLLYDAPTRDELNKATNDIISVMGLGKDGLIEMISQTKKHQVLFKIANKCSQIFNVSEMG